MSYKPYTASKSVILTRSACFLRYTCQACDFLNLHNSRIFSFAADEHERILKSARCFSARSRSSVPLFGRVCHNYRVQSSGFRALRAVGATGPRRMKDSRGMFFEHTTHAYLELWHCYAIHTACTLHPGWFLAPNLGVARCICRSLAEVYVSGL